MIDHASESFPMLIKEISCLGSSDVAGLIQTPKPSFTLFVAGDNNEQAFFNRAASSLGLAPGEYQCPEHWIIYTIQ